MQTIKTNNYNFNENDLMARLTVISQASEDVIKKKLSGIEYIAFIERQIKEINFINRVFEAKRNNQSEVEIYG
jgi:hypothetical protein